MPKGKLKASWDDYEALPTEIRDDFTRKQLLGLLQTAPRWRAKKFFRDAKRLRKHYQPMPPIESSRRKAEMCLLLEALEKDAKSAYNPSLSKRDEILQEVMETLSAWLTTIWINVYEYQTNFREAHDCLLHISSIFNLIDDLMSAGKCSGCKCSESHPTLDIVIRRSTGAVLKDFDVHSSHNGAQPLLWVWRELFVSMSSRMASRARKHIASMLRDIQDALGWHCVERILWGGETARYPYNPFFNDLSDEDEDDNDNDEDDDINKELCDCSMHGRHWSAEINQQRHVVRRLVFRQLLDTFQLAPCSSLADTIKDISPDYEATEMLLEVILRNVATHSSDNFVAALEIYSDEENLPELSSLLENHYYLLRPQDTSTLQLALTTLLDARQYRIRAIAMVEKELFSLIDHIAAGVNSCFCDMSEQKNQTELRKILSLSAGSDRTNRIATWVGEVLTPSASPAHPAAFAAVMFGFHPPILQEGEDIDLLDFLNLSTSPEDPDLIEVEERLRPQFKTKFELWENLCKRTKGGQTILAKAYVKLIDLMPYLKGADVVEEMVDRLQHRVSKQNICDILEGLAEFCKIQRKKILAKEKKRKETQAQSQGSSQGGSNTLNTGPFTFIFGSNASGVPFMPVAPSTSTNTPQPGSIDDVD